MYNTAIKVLNKINVCGFKAYIVGGYPRDMFLNRKSYDIDICTDATPKDLKEIFKSSMLPKESYGSVTVIFQKVRFEITTFRKDINYENNRQPSKIKYVKNLLDDLKRRDFTINTICIDSGGNIIDLLNGRHEIETRTIKMVGNPKYKLKEDSLRILRAIRFATVLDFKLDGKLKKYIIKYGYLLKKLSYYRKKEELERIFSSTNVEKGLKLIKELKLDQYLELFNLDNIKITSTTIGIWAQLDVTNIYDFNSNDKECIMKIKELKDKDVLDKFNLYHYGPYVSSIVAELNNIDKKIVNEKYMNLPIKSRKEIDIDTAFICNALNKKPGSFLKTILDDLEQKILIGDLVNSKEVLEEYIINNYKK